MGEPTNTPCVVCGGIPTRVETIQRHVGMLILQRFVRLKQPLCKVHGNEITHQYLNKTLLEGWWGVIAFFVNFYVVGHDLLVLRRFDALDDPQPAQAEPAAASSGWYPDPAGRFEHRWHDGREWTANVARQGQQFDDPLAAG